MLSQHGTLEISRSRFRNNLAALRRRIGPAVKCCATIKANAYGHGIEPIASLLEEEHIDWVCVYSLQEALTLIRSYNFNILVLAPLVLQGDSSPAVIKRLQEWEEGEAWHIRFNVTDIETARLLSASAIASGKKLRIPVHVQVDAGLTRVGVEPRDAEELADAVAMLPGLRLEGIFAHFSHGDVPHHGTIEQQLAILQRVAGPLKEQFPDLLVHLQNSGGTWYAQPRPDLDMVRIGIALYGLQPSVDDPIPEIFPIGQVTAPILAIHDRPPGTGVGYGHTFVTARHSRLAVVPVGYADGYPRLLSNRGVAQLHGVDVPLVGRVSMDQIVLDITEVPAAKVGDQVTVISHDGAQANSLDTMADDINTIGYELATHLGQRLHRVIVD